MGFLKYHYIHTLGSSRWLTLGEVLYVQCGDGSAQKLESHSDVASVMLYSSSVVAFASPFLGVKVTVSPSLTAKTESSSRYFESESKICVVTGLNPSA